MRTVYKYPLGFGDEQMLELPAGARVLHVEEQGGTPMLWALVDPDAPKLERWFRMAGTGHPIRGSQKLLHISTFTMMDGRLVFHLFEVEGEGRENGG